MDKSPFMAKVRPGAGVAIFPSGRQLWYEKENCDSREKHGPPAAGKGEPIVVRMHPPQLAALDDWIARQAQPFPSRPEAIRRLSRAG
jgi:hypothetical protein